MKGPSPRCRFLAGKLFPVCANTQQSPISENEKLASIAELAVEVRLEPGKKVFSGRKSGLDRHSPGVGKRLPGINPVGFARTADVSCRVGYVSCRIRRGGIRLR